MTYVPSPAFIAAAPEISRKINPRPRRRMTMTHVTAQLCGGGNRRRGDRCRWRR
ncbi:hypothetical protein KCP73_22065 [Salmonella enterica subsp. enterica]|nr:hypothetical protein KCP73_22065 [Salmonella enterica subsp. enterica]